MTVLSCVAACGGGDERVPNLAGQRLDVAIALAEEADIEHQELGGGMFGILEEDNWYVCDQRPSAGQLPGDTPVLLIVERECEEVTGLSGGTVPELIGERVDVARAELVDSNVGYTSAGNAKGGYRVCAMNPPPGTDEVDQVELIARQKCK